MDDRHLDVRVVAEQAFEPHRTVDGGEAAAEDHEASWLVLGDGTPPPAVAVRDEGHQQPVEDDMTEDALTEHRAEEDERREEHDRERPHQDTSHDQHAGQPLDERHPQDKCRRLNSEGRNILHLEDRQHQIGLEELVVDAEIREVRAGEYLQEKLGACPRLAREPGREPSSAGDSGHWHVVRAAPLEK
jgi:hypothetical protein